MLLRGQLYNQKQGKSDSLNKIGADICPDERVRRGIFNTGQEVFYCAARGKQSLKLSKKKREDFLKSSRFFIIVVRRFLKRMTLSE